MSGRTRIEYTRKDGATYGEIAVPPQVVMQAMRATAAFNAHIARLTRPPAKRSVGEN